MSAAERTREKRAAAKKERRKKRAAARKELDEKRGKASDSLREWQEATGRQPDRRPTPSNRKMTTASVEEEREERADTLLNQMLVMKTMLPIIFEGLGSIEDPRQQAKVKYPLAQLLFFGILMFVYQMSSRRQANREMTSAQLRENLRLFFPEIDDLPHQDTLARLLEKLDPDEIGDCLFALLRTLLRRKKLRRFLLDDGYLRIAFDASQVTMRDTPLNDRCLERSVGTGENKRTRYPVVLLEAVVVLGDGLSLPHMLMRIGHFLNVIVQISLALAQTIRSITFKTFIAYVRATLTGPWLDQHRDPIQQRLAGCLQLRLE